MGVEITITTKEFDEKELQRLKEEGSELLEFIKDENNRKIVHQILEQYLNTKITQNTLENLINSLTLQIGDKKNTYNHSYSYKQPTYTKYT
jgi:oligoribonuclease NrnB/cAMP/cGMP phosphodiesterase (DHH superfamily)